MNFVLAPECPPSNQYIVSYHDESAIHANDCQRRAWKLEGETGTMEAKNKGICIMVAAYVCADFGMWMTSMRTII